MAWGGFVDGDCDEEEGMGLEEFWSSRWRRVWSNGIISKGNVVEML